MARQCWDESRHCEISVKLGDHMGTEIGEYTESTFLFAAACNPDPVLRLCGVNRALEGLAIDVFSSMKDFGNESGDPVLEFCEDWMLADEVTHVKMGSDWLRRLTDKDPERRERALEFQRTVDSIFNLGGFRGEDDENPIQLARRFRRARRLHRRGERLPRRAGPRSRPSRRARWPRWPPSSATPQAAADGVAVRTAKSRSAKPTLGAAAGHGHAGPVHADRLLGGRHRRRSSRTVAALIGLPATSRSQLDVDEELFAPLVGHMSDVVDGRMVSSGSRVRTSRTTAGPARSRPSRPAATSRSCLLRGQDRLSADFADAPPDGELERGPSARPGTSTPSAGPQRLGMPVRRQAQIYEFRLQHGFTDVADAAFERLWETPIDDVGRRSSEICKETGAADRGASKIPVDLLRQK